MSIFNVLTSSTFSKGFVAFIFLLGLPIILTMGTDLLKDRISKSVHSFFN